MMNVVGLTRPKANYFRNELNRMVNGSSESNDETISDVDSKVTYHINMNLLFNKSTSMNYREF